MELTILAMILVWAFCHFVLGGLIRWLRGKPTKTQEWCRLGREGRLVLDGARWMTVETDGSMRRWK